MSLKGIPNQLTGLACEGLKGKTVGVLELGAIGSLVAQLGLEFGMDVIGFDPAISIEAAWQLPSSVKRMENMQALFSRADFI